MPLIKTIEEVQDVLNISSLNGVTSLPDFDTAEDLYIKPVLKDVYTVLHTAYEANNMSALQQQLLKKVQKPLAAFAYIDDAGLMNIVFTDSGFRQVSTEDMPAAFKWQYNAALDSLKTRAYNAMEELFRFLEANKPALSWDDSDRKKTLITNGIDFSDHYSLFQPLRTFFLLRPVMLKVEDLYIKQAIGSAFLEELKGKQSPTADEEEVLRNLKLAIVHFTIKHAMETMPVRKSEGGMTVLNSTADKDAFEGNQASAPDALLHMEKQAAERDGQEYLKRAKRLLNSKASSTVFATYFDSELYTAPPTAKLVSFNAGKKTFRF